MSDETEWLPIDPPVGPEGVMYLDWASEQPRNGVRVSRVELVPENRTRDPLHTHAFAELLLIEVGRCENVTPDGMEILEAGDFRCLRPWDVHLPRSGPEPCTIVNLSFLLEPLAEFEARYGADWMWAREGPPRGGRLSPLLRDRLSTWLDLLASLDLRRIDREACILDLSRMLSADLPAARATGLPAWLVTAVEIFTDPVHLPGGVVELARLSGRSREHVNRVVRVCQGRRATDLVNAIRLDWVALELRHSDKPVERLAAECGLPNLAHFYRLFRAAYGVTPAVWRRHNRAAFPRNQALNLAPWGRE